MSPTPPDRRDPPDFSDPRADRHDVSRLHAPIARESDEPQDGFEPVPMAFMFAVVALAMWGGWYLGSFNGNFEAAQLDGAPPSASESAAAATAPVDPMVLGRRVFNNCMACHQADGRGVPGQFPPLAGSEWVVGSTDRLARILLHGLAGEVTVAGKTYNGVMPAWAKLDDAAIAAVLTYIRGSWGNGAAPVTADAIGAARRETADHRGAWTAGHLLALPDAAPAATGAGP